MARAWYSYDGTGDVNQRSNYLYSTVKPACTTGARICSIYAIYGGANPSVISQNLSDYIAAGLATGVPQPQTPVGTKKYVYLKTGL